MKNLLGVLAGLTAAAIWGGMYVVSKVVLDIVPPFSLLSLRLILAVLALGVVWLVRPGERRGMNRKVVATAVGVGAIGFGLSLGLQFVGTKLSTASNAALVTSASPAFMVAFAIWILGERATVRRMAALAVATLGVLVVVDPAHARLDAGAFWGNLALLGAALTWGLFSVLSKWAARRLPVLTVSLLGFVGGLFLALPAAGLELQRSQVGALTVPVWMGILYLGVISTALAVFLWNQALAMLDAGVVSLLFFGQPVVGAGLGSTLLGEPLPLSFWIGGLLIAIGVLLVSWREAPAPSRTASTKPEPG
jgi:drug/metabolite transporter (DMT)-like permease